MIVLRRLVSFLLTLVPSRLTGRTAPEARRLVRTHFDRNPTVLDAQWGGTLKVILWGGLHPSLFACALGALCLILAVDGVLALEALASTTFWPDTLPKALPEKFDFTTFFATVFSAQATIAAVAYPIVISFIAVILQRRSTAKATLEVYVLDSGILPAGFSAIALLAIMSVEYFGTVFIPKEFVGVAMLFNALWLVTNIFLTGYFLVRTLRFIQDEEGFQAFKRIAVTVVLKAEIAHTLKRRQIPRATSTTAAWLGVTGKPPALPVVRFFTIGRGTPAVLRKFSARQVLNDVHLNLLAWVARRWLERAMSSMSGIPILEFPNTAELPKPGVIPLCLIDNGPALTFTEKLAITVAFDYRKPRSRVVSRTTATMLAELSTEIQALAQQRRYTASVEAFRALLQLHATLIRACSGSENQPVSRTAGLELEFWQDSSAGLASEWLECYRPIVVLAVRLLPEDSSLFEQLAYFANRLVSSSGNQSYKTSMQALQIPWLLTSQLGLWWADRISSGGSLPGPAAGRLAQPYAKVYESAIVEFMGGWNSFVFTILDTTHSDEVQWQSHCARALTYATHIEDSANLVLDAVSRGDTVAATWFGDQFIKWRGSRQYELDTRSLDIELGYGAVRLSLAEQDWSAAQDTLLKIFGQRVSISEAGDALAYAIHKYWESLRIVLCAMLLGSENKPTSALSGSVAAKLLHSRPDCEGGDVLADSFTNASEFMAAVLDTCFGDVKVSARLNKFRESADRTPAEPIVKGRVYSRTYAYADITTMYSAYATLALTFDSDYRQRSSSIKQVEGWWREIDKLGAVANFAHQIQKAIRKKSARFCFCSANELRTAIDVQGAPGWALVQLHRLCKSIGTVALHERKLWLRSSLVPVGTLAAIAAGVSKLVVAPDIVSKTYPSMSIALSSKLGEKSYAPTVKVEKEKMLAEVGEFEKDWLWCEVAKSVRGLIIESSVAATLAGYRIVGHHRVAIPATLREIVGRCQELGVSADPVILLPQAELSALLRATAPDVKHLLPREARVRRANPNAAPFAAAYVNDVPVISLETPNDDWFVVPRAIIAEIPVCGLSPECLLRLTCRDNGESVELAFDWESPL